jgi:serine/threonine protein phosphatase PrpC
VQSEDRTAKSGSAWDFAGDDMVGDRKGQEDYHAFDQLKDGSGLLAILADGMGGHEAGEVASRVAVEAFSHRFGDHSADSTGARLGAALEAANAMLASVIQNEPEREGMGCTLLAAHISKAGLIWISVGDSPLYLVRKGKIRQLNQDHSMAPQIQARLKEGKITAAEAQDHPHRNVLLSALTGDEGPELIDCPNQTLRLMMGDVVILASDGLQTLSEAEIVSVIQTDGGAKEIANRLLSAVTEKRKARQDNATVQIIRVDGAIAHRSSGRRKILTLALLAATALVTVAIALDVRANDPLGICQAISLPLKAISTESSFNLCADGVKHSGR